MRAHALIALALLAGVFAVYEPLRQHDFVDYDDAVYLAKLRPGWSQEGLRRAVSEPVVSNWIPITMLSLLAGQAVHGPDASGHLAVNALLHGLAAVGLYATLVLGTGAVLPSAFVAGVFAVHPLHVESVAWLSQRKDVLCGLFWIAALAAHMGWVRRPNATRYIALLLATGLALLSKPMAVTLPFTLLLLDYWPLGRLRSDGALPSGAALARAVIEKLPLFALAAIVSIITYQVQSSTGAVAASEALPFDVRAANAVQAIIAYAADAFWPRDLAVFYPHSQRIASPLALGLAVAGLAAVTLAALRQAAARPQGIVGWLWFLGTLVPVLGLVQVGEQARADRYTYIPLIGLSIAVAFSAAQVVERRPRLRPLMLSLAAVALIALGLAARMQVGHWRDSQTLYTHALAVTGDNAFAHRGLGRALRRAGRLEEAEQQLAAALQLEPEHPVSRRELAEIRAERGDVAGAIAHYQALLRVDPDDLRARINLGQLLVRAQRMDEAQRELTDALARSHGSHLPVAFRRTLHLNLARAFAANRELAEARLQAEAALALDPSGPAARVVLADLALRAGEWDEAATQLERAAQLADQRGETALADALRARRRALEAGPE